VLTLPRPILAHAFEGMAEGVAVVASPSGEIIYLNQAAERMFGYESGELLGQPSTLLSAAPPGDNKQRFARIHKSLDATDRWSGELRARCKDGSELPLNVRISTTTLDGKTYRVVVYEDLAERHRAEQALALNETRTRQIFEADLLGFIAWDLQGAIVEANNAFLGMIGYTREEFETEGILWETITPPEFRARDHAAIVELRETGRCGHFEKEFFHKDGSRVPVLIGASILAPGDERGVSFVLDIKERKEAERAALAAQQRFEAFMDNSHAVAFMKDHQGRYVYMNRRLLETFPHLGDSWFGKRDIDLWPENVEQFVQHDHDVLFAGAPVQVVQQMRGPNGETMHWQVSKFPFLDISGHVFIGGMALNITDQVQAKEKLQLVEEQVRQSQKMEAVGRLAGGVAHDFNNLLTVINGCSELLLEQLSKAHPGHALAKEIHNAGERAAALTRQLLAFSRRQVLQPKVLDINDMLQHLEQILRRALGPDIEIVLELGKDLGQIKVDPAQLDQVVINLAVNARDAMPGGGRLTLATSDLEITEDMHDPDGTCLQGRYVRLTVSDTGHGMDDATRASIFEPFFTTKEAGKGTGLGLAMVYGFVRQSGGRIQVASQVGKGTQFTIDLPCVKDAISEQPATQPQLRLPKGTETVMIVEDEEGIRAWTCQVLESCGYHVLEAGHGQQAIALDETFAAPIDLLVTDVVMPRMSGRQVAEVLQQRHPQMRVLFVSGYTDDSIIRRGILSSTAAFLQKPFSAVALAHKVREMLDLPRNL
jgi:two-component system cell cycle sensor histidine kinase/response regulator CckA